MSRRPAIVIQLVLGYDEGFETYELDLISNEAGDYSDSPENLLLEIEKLMETGELTEDEVRQFLTDRSKS